MSDNHWDERNKADHPAAEALDNVRTKQEGKEWRLLERLVDGLYVEQRRSRRWGILFKSLTFLYLFVLLGVGIFGGFSSDSEPAVEEHTAVINIQGPISSSEEASADKIVGAMREAFEAENSKAVVLRINSPGGSPVQSGYIYDEVKRLRALYPEKKAYAVIVDIGASGAYYIAAAADEIYADKASLVGSIGVVAGGFGFVDLMEKVGVERRLYTAGEHKALLDPFSPQNDNETRLWQQVLDTTHRQFIEQVKKGRGDRLKDDEQLFSGLVWSGEQALELGLLDGLGSTSYVARELVGVEEIVDYTSQPDVWQKVLDRFSVTFAKTIATEIGLNGNTLQLK